MPRTAAGLLMFRRRPTGIEVLLVHPGGPFHATKDHGAWSIPKGETEPGEDLLAAAQREFEEETGFKPTGPFIESQPVRLKTGKVVHAWACEGDCDPTAIRSNTFTMEWPPRSGRMAEFPEVDRAAWLSLDQARKKISPGQVGLLEELEGRVGRRQRADSGA